jgi:hypothetical protein
MSENAAIQIEFWTSVGFRNLVVHRKLLKQEATYEQPPLRPHACLEASAKRRLASAERWSTLSKDGHIPEH